MSLLERSGQANVKVIRLFYFVGENCYSYLVDGMSLGGTSVAGQV